MPTRSKQADSGAADQKTTGWGMRILRGAAAPLATSTASVRLPVLQAR